MCSKVVRVVCLYTLIVAATFLLTHWAFAQSTPEIVQEVAVTQEFSPWTWQHPKPQGNDLNSIACPSPDKCIMGGRTGAYSSPETNKAFVIKSENDYTNWDMQNLEGHGINRIHCISNSICYTASFFGHVLKTINGGETWTTTITNSNKQLYDIYCLTSVNCIAVGEQGTIQQTTNGGQSWITRTTNTPLDILGIDCPTPSLCLAAGGSGSFGNGDGIILRSQNGGVSWTIISNRLANILNAVACPSTNKCIAVGWGGLIYLSKDSGATWQQTASHMNDILSAIECPSANKCFITSRSGYIYHSENGFVWLKDDAFNRISLSDISCFSSSHCTVVGENGYIASTKNGGKDWSTITQGNLTSESLWVCYKNGNYCQAEPGNQIKDVGCFTDNKCIAVGNKGLIFLGNILTQIWQEIDIDTTQNLLGISCLNNSTCLISGSNGGIWKSTDGGMSWTSKPSGTAKRLFDIQCKSPNTCYAIGEMGMVLKSTNAGDSWTSLNSQTASDLKLINCPTSSTCYVITYDENVLVTSNGGQNWALLSNLPHNPNYYLTSIFCSAAQDCFLIDRWSDSRLYYTTNGGTSWSTINVGENFGFNNITCNSLGSCLIVGNMGITLRSKDFGETWQKESAPEIMSLETGFCLDNNSCVIVGMQGFIFASVSWPELQVEHDFSGSSLAHQTSLTGTINVVNSGTISATQIAISNNLPSALQGSGPVHVKWAGQHQIINTLTLPNLTAGLDITLLPGEELSIEYPVNILNPANKPLQVVSKVSVNSLKFPEPIQTQTELTLASNSTFLPLIISSPPISCSGPFKDDFQNAGSGWPIGSNSNTSYSYVNGEYSISHTQPNRWFSTLRDDYWQSGDYLVEIVGYQLSGKGAIGLLFGLTNNEFYTFEIIPDLQKWYVFRYRDGLGWDTIFYGDAASIASGTGKNHLIIQGANNKMFFAINNQWVYELAEKPGYVGLTGASLNGTAHLRYDNYLYHSQGCSVISQAVNANLPAFREKIETRTIPLP